MTETLLEERPVVIEDSEPELSHVGNPCQCGCGLAAKPGNKFLVGHNGRANMKANPKFRANTNRSTGPSPKSPPKRKPKIQKTGTDYREGILGMIQIPAFGLAMAGAKNPVLAMDSAAISHHAPPIAEALNNLAQKKPEVAAALDRVLAVGPYGEIIAAVLPLALQLMANHGIVEAGEMGTQRIEVQRPEQDEQPQADPAAA